MLNTAKKTPNKQKTASADIQRTMEKDVKVTHTFDCI